MSDAIDHSASNVDMSAEVRTAEAMRLHPSHLFSRLSEGDSVLVTQDNATSYRKLRVVSVDAKTGILRLQD